METSCREKRGLKVLFIKSEGIQGFFWAVCVACVEQCVEVLKDTALMAAMTSDLNLPKGRWHEVPQRHRVVSGS